MESKLVFYIAAFLLAVLAGCGARVENVYKTYVIVPDAGAVEDSGNRAPDTPQSQSDGADSTDSFAVSDGEKDGSSDALGEAMSEASDAASEVADVSDGFSDAEVGSEADSADGGDVADAASDAGKANDCWVSIWAAPVAYYPETSKIRQPFGRAYVVLAKMAIKNSLPTQVPLALQNLRVKFQLSPGAKGLANFRLLMWKPSFTLVSNVFTDIDTLDTFTITDPAATSIQFDETRFLYLVADVMGEKVAVAGSTYTPYLENCVKNSCPTAKFSKFPELVEGGHICIGSPPGKQVVSWSTEIVDQLVAAKGEPDFVKKYPTVPATHQIVGVYSLESKAVNYSDQQPQPLKLEFLVTTNAASAITNKPIAVWFYQPLSKLWEKVCSGLSYANGKIVCQPLTLLPLYNLDENYFAVEVDTSGFQSGDTLQLSLVGVLWQDGYGTLAIDKVGGLPAKGIPIYYSGPGF